MMKIRLYLTLFVLCCALQSKALVTNWTGTSSTDWFTATNWSNGVPGINDDAQIGIVNTYTNSPVIGVTTTVKSLTFGTRSSGSLTINSGIIFTVINDIIVRYASASATLDILGQTVSGVLGGTINCNGSVYIGDSTAPITPAQGGTINATYVVTVNVAIQRINISGNLVLNTTSASANVTNVGYSSNVNNSSFHINNGYVNVTNNLQTTNSAYVSTALSGYTTASNTARLVVNEIDNNIVGSASTLAFGGTLSIGTAGFVDFYGAGVGSSTVVYTGAAAQTVYTPATTGLGVQPANYQNLVFSGSGVKTFQSGSVTIGRNWTSAGGKIDAATNLTTIDFTGTTQTLTDAGSNNGEGVLLNNVIFRGSGTKTFSSGKFLIANTGVVTMGGTASLAAGGNLTLLSGTTSSATVAALPAGTAITGNVNVQRLIKGSSTDLSKRGYRFISSAVYTATVGGVKCFDVKYLLDSAYVSGMSGGGFNATSTNPSLYLYREDVLQNNTAFTAGHYKGIAKVNNINAYDIGTQKRLTSTNVADTTVNLPIGNGLLFFFRGNKSNNTTQAGSKLTAPFDFPEDVAFTQTGQLNTGTVNVRPWYKFDNTTNPNNYLPYTNSPSLNNSVTRGFILVGNPYASSINWEKFNRNGTNSSIYGGGFPAASVTQSKIWIYNPTTKQYDTYMQAPSVSAVADTTTTVKPSGSIATGDASNMIASGQGFLIRATTTGQTLSFRETAKTNTQPAAANLIRVMSAPVNMGAMAFSSAPQPSNNVAGVVPMLSFRLIKDSINTDDVVLAFNNRTGNNFSPDDDAEDLHGNGALVSLSVVSDNKVSASIKQLRLPEIGWQIISLAADATVSGRYQLRLNKIENLPARYNVWLTDAFTNDSLDIKNNNTYTFDIDKSKATTFGANRFKIIVSYNQARAMRTLSFNAEKTIQGAKLTWQTENEADDYLFVIERSTDNGKTYKKLGQLNSSGISAYSFYDTQPAVGLNQYKISVESIATNKEEHTAIAKLNYDNPIAGNTSVGSKISVYPNPATHTVNIKMDEATETSNNSYAVRITNSMGLIVKEIKSSQPNVQENIARLTPGTYLVKVVNTTLNKIQGETKFVKLN
jgi:hypothetical protein